MTYLETITYLTGRFLQVSQFALKNALRLVFLTEGAKKVTPYLKNSSEYKDSLSAEAIALFHSKKSNSGEEWISYFETHEGISQKDQKNLYKMLRKRDYIVGTYFYDNSADLGKEDVGIYESKITELKELVSLGEKLSVSLERACDKLYLTF
jgi:hypothetical protein